jgi:quinoprotein glucose dehydrogenase
LDIGSRPENFLPTNLVSGEPSFVKVTGKLLWETLLPFSRCATPATYEIDRRQYDVIAAGGQRDSSTLAGGGLYVEYALPQ